MFFFLETFQKADGEKGRAFRGISQSKKNLDFLFFFFFICFCINELLFYVVYSRQTVLLFGVVCALSLFVLSLFAIKLCWPKMVNVELATSFSFDILTAREHRTAAEVTEQKTTTTTKKGFA